MQQTLKFALPVFWGGSLWNPLTPKKPASGLNMYVGRPVELTSLEYDELYCGLEKLGQADGSG